MRCRGGRVLLDLPTYRTMTGDLSNLDSDVMNALPVAQQQLEEALGRGYVDNNPFEADGVTPNPNLGLWVSGLEYGTRTEIIRLHYDGRAYPMAIPIFSVSQPPSVIIRDDYVMGIIPTANPLWDILYEPYRFGPGGSGGDWDTTLPIGSLTYTGGYTLATLPRKLRQAICDLATIEMTVFNPTLAGITEAVVGDVHAIYADAPDRAGVTAAILQEVRGFKRREIGH